MICPDATLTGSIDVIRGEFREMPGLVLTRDQFQRLWGLDGPTCAEAIDLLVQSRFLVQKADGRYAHNQSAA